MVSEPTKPSNYSLPAPTGAVESDRLTLQHRIWVLQHHDRLHATPLDHDQPQHVLDLCCGTGVWTRAFAAQSPNSVVLGVDISPPTLTAKSQAQHPTTEFVYGDAEGSWEFAASRPPFTFIYGRMLANSIRDWDHMFAQAARHLVPGGYFQLDDVAHAFFAEDIGITEAQSPMMYWWRVVFQATSAFNGIDVNALWKHTGRIRDAGFRFHRAEIVRWYFGGRGKRATPRENAIADFWLEDMEALVPRMTEIGISQGALEALAPDEARTLAKEAVRDIKENGVERGYYMEFSIHVAQKIA